MAARGNSAMKLLLFVALWWLCSGAAQAGTLADRLMQFPDWQGKPPVQAAQGDLAYPDWFAGTWRVNTTLVDMVAPLAPEIVTPGFDSNRQFLNQPIAFPVRFIIAPQRRTASRKLPEIVSDRAYNGMSLAKAYLGDRAVRAVNVDPDNPNRQITVLRGDRQLVSTVTARATEAPAPEQFITTELFRQEFRGAPQLYFNEVENTTAYTHHREAQGSDTDRPAITADQVTAIYLSPQDPDYFQTTNGFLGEPCPVALYRYRMEFFPTP